MKPIKNNVKAPEKVLFFSKTISMNNFYKLFLFVVICCITSCKKKETEHPQTQASTQTLIPFKEIPFELDSLENELLFTTNQTVTLYASTDTINSQIKQIDKAPYRRLFVTDETDTFYTVHYFQYGSTPLSYQGYVKKDFFEKKDPYSLDLVNLDEIRYSNLKGIYNDQDKSFSKYGTIKLVSYDFYRKQKNKLVSNFITHASDISFNNETKTYSFQTNSGEQIDVLQHNDTEEGMPTYLLKGFSTALQRYVFEVKEDGNQYYAYYSKRRSDIEPLYTSSLPVYNKSNRHFAQLYNDDDVGSLFIVQSLNNDFDFTEQLLVNFTNFKVKNESVYWISNNTVVAEVYHTNQTDDSKSSYVLIEFNI